MVIVKRSRTSLAKALRRVLPGLWLCVAASGGAPAQEREAPAASPPDRTDQSQDRNLQQPTRERTRELLREEGIAPSAEERRSQLRELNDIHRELMPPGSTVPAPGSAVNPAQPGGRD